MTRPPRVSGQDVVRTLLREGFYLSHIRGSHHYLRKPGSTGLVVVLVHGNRTLPAGTLLSVLRQAGLTPDEFRALLGR